MSLEYGIDRYADLLAKYFKDNPGPRGPDGYSNTLIAMEARDKYVGANTSYTGLTHIIAAGELTPDDTIICNVWWYPFSILTLNVSIRWQTPSGDQIAVMAFNNNAAINMMFSYGQDAGDTSILVATSFQTLVSGNKSTSAVQITNADMSPRYNWIEDGGSVVLAITTGVATGLNPGVYVKTFYSHMKRRQ